uniref:Putative chemotaxis methyl-accepting receptor, signalling n=1 Tax=Magnetococcus massalia (strain MO-1) TaxID=451514 RepID=A0A1S7LEV6_MAGMO|nr:Putative chemotaxis methyl-accepting receptor, signalling [Candidatus Magnetococcus massalia]
MHINDIPFKPKLLGLFMLIGLLPMILVAVVTDHLASDALVDEAYGKLVSIRQIKRAQIERFFAERQGDMGVLVETAATLRSEAFAKLTAVRQTKQQSVQRYLTTVSDQMATFAQNEMVVQAMAQFRDAYGLLTIEAPLEDAERSAMKRSVADYYSKQFGVTYTKSNGGKAFKMDGIMGQLSDRALMQQYAYISANSHPLGQKHKLDGADRGVSYDLIHKRVHPIIRDYLERFGYYDIFLVDDKSGEIIYSVFKETDYSRSLNKGVLDKTNFAQAFKDARKLKPGQITTVDFARYWPSYEAPAGFIASPVFKEGKRIGVAVFQFPIDRLNAIMEERAGLGKTGETYLVGPDKLMRSNSFHDRDNRSVGASFANPKLGKVDSDAVKRALKGKSGTEVIINYKGNPVLSAYAPIKAAGLNWALLAEVNVAEAFSPVDGEGQEFFKRYQELYGYYDVFLLNPDGFVFYSAAKEGDLNTNMVSGKYKDSNFGQLVRDVIQSKKFGFADFAPYAPSNDEPAAFIAQPVVHDGEVELIVGLQIPLDGINAIMKEREGMGETGETYLVGPDKRMRSDSFLDAKGRSVNASFAGTIANNGVDTEASNSALSGQTDARIITDYNGNPVLSAFTPISVYGTRWGLLAEVDEAEVMQPVDKITYAIIVLALIMVVVIVIVALLVANNLTLPIRMSLQFASELAGGKLHLRMACTRKDEMGELARSLNSMAEGLQQIVGDIRQRADRLQATAKHLGEVSNTMHDGAEGLRSQSQQVASASEQVSASMQSISSATEQMNSSMRQVSTNAEGMHQNMNTISAAAEEANVNLSTVASATEEVTANMDGVNRSAEHTGENVSRVASAVEELTATIQDVKTRCERADAESRQASQNAQETVGVMSQLGSSSQEINKVISAIKNIADQTNMLALNASIEAAGAGEAGKGFAVVANEVKELAGQTSDATKEIANRVGDIQSNSQTAGYAIEEINTIITGLAQVVEDILGAVEEQSATVSEISHSMGEVSHEAQEVSQRVNEATQGANEVARSVQEISVGIGEVTQSVLIASTGVEEMSRLVQESFQASDEISQQVSESTQAVTDVSSKMREVNGAAAKMGELSESVQSEAQDMADISKDLQSALAKFELEAK